jgi:carboxyl-terminal processing protease
MRRVIPPLFASCLAILLVVVIFVSGAAVGATVPAIRQAAEGLFAATSPASTSQAPAETPLSGTLTPETRDDLFAPFWEVWDILHEDFVDQPLDNTALMRGAIRGMLDALGDEHTAYMDPDEYRQANMGLEGSYEGIGAWVDTDSEYLTIISPMPGSPAEKAGLEPGDQIIAIDGEDMTGIDGNLVIRKVLGPAGSTVVLTIAREGAEDPFDVTVTRGSIEIPSVESNLVEEGIGYVRLYSFGENTNRDLEKALRSLKAADARSVILDLRGNGGGYLDTAIEVSSQFISQGEIVTERFGDGREQVYKAAAGGLATDWPMAVLIDGGSASASEIVAGAIQDAGRGKLIGETSFGKGSVQNWVPLKDDQGAVRVTIARWYTPNGRQIHGQGLEPDIAVPFTEADAQADRDPQLDRALEVIRGLVAE